MGLLKGIASLLKPEATPKPRVWPQRPEDLPWFDRPNAMETLEARRRAGDCDDAHFELLRQWIDDGYCVPPDPFAESEIDAMQADLDGVWTANEPIPGLVVGNARVGEPEGLAHDKLLALDPAERDRLKSSAHWRIQGFHHFSGSTRRIFQDKRLTALASLIMGEPSSPSYTINFIYGSKQHLHQDAYVFAVYPLGFMIGAWLACEDVDPDSGPLVYYPGSHRLPPYEAFDNYPQSSLKTCDAQTTEVYDAHLARAAERYERKEFIAKKGQILLWHALLIHGGSPVRDPALSRKSYVCHYIADGKDRLEDLQGPFNW